jgi:predicted Zn-dependent protease
MKQFKDYNKQELFDRINKISIEKSGDQVITKYENRVINTTKVSNRYEIFDIVKYLKDKISKIEENFNISKYEFKLTRGQQYLKLISDKVEIGGIDFYKSFYILNSTDKSRRLGFNVGLYCDTTKFYIISGVRNVGLTKKHLKGVTQAAEEATVGLNDETFNEQIDSIKSIVGHRVSLSKLREVILGDKVEVPQINHRKFDAFKNSIRFAASNGQLKVTNEQRTLLMTESDKIKEIDKSVDFYIDAFYAFQLYLTLFNKQDSHIIKSETERILGITQWAVRNNVLESLGI